MKAVFDTNILIDYLGGIAQAQEELKLYDQKIISVITYIEILVGAKTIQEEAILMRFLTNFVIRQIDDVVANTVIRLRRQHKRKLPDAIIYATAKVENCLLVTRNVKDFDPVLPDVRLPYSL